MIFAWEDADRFLCEGVFPAARKVGAEVRCPTPEQHFFDGLPWEVKDGLGEFDVVSRKALPLNREESEAWQAFVVAAYRSTASFDRDLMRDWFVKVGGWSGPSAEELTGHFFDECRLLARYRDTLVIA